MEGHVPCGDPCCENGYHLALRWGGGWRARGSWHTEVVKTSQALEVASSLAAVVQVALAAGEELNEVLGVDLFASAGRLHFLGSSCWRLSPDYEPDYEVRRTVLLRDLVDACPRCLGNVSAVEQSGRVADPSWAPGEGVAVLRRLERAKRAAFEGCDAVLDLAVGEVVRAADSTHAALVALRGVDGVLGALGVRVAGELTDLTAEVLTRLTETVLVQEAQRAGVRRRPRMTAGVTASTDLAPSVALVTTRSRSALAGALLLRGGVHAYAVPGRGVLVAGPAWEVSVVAGEDAEVLEAPADPSVLEAVQVLVTDGSMLPEALEVASAL